MFKRLRGKAQIFRTADDGVVAMLFGLTVIPIFIIGGMATDYAAAARRKIQLQGSTDATALAAGKDFFEKSEANVNEDAKKFFDAVTPDKSARITAVKITDTGGLTELCITAATASMTNFTRLVGITKLNVSATSCVTAGTRDFEIALSLDVSGSMGGTKISAMKSAATNFVNDMMGPGAQSASARISIIPFNHNVAVDPNDVAGASWVDYNAQSPYHWGNDFTVPPGFVGNRFAIYNNLKALSSSWKWQGCFNSLPYPENTQEQDAALTGVNTRTLLVPSLAPDSSDQPSQYKVNNYLNDDGTTSGSNCTAAEKNDYYPPRASKRICKYVTPKIASSVTGTPNVACGSPYLVRLTNNTSTLKNKISSLSAGGFTNIHQGAWWAWNTLSPKAAFRDGKDYTDKTNIKVMVLMTDGDNTWYADSTSSLFRSDYSAYGYYTNTDPVTGLQVSQPPTSVTGATLSPPTSTNSGTNANRAYAIMNDLTRRTCANMRNAGIVIYSIAFAESSGDISSDGKKLLEDCAGDKSRYFESNSTQLSATFKRIAKEIGDLRILR